jgi:Protein of unknown function (DUF3592)
VTGVGWMGAVTTFIGAGLTAGGALMGLYHRRRERQAQVPGTVVALVEQYHLKSRNKLYAPVFEYIAVNGTKVRKQSTTASYPATHAVGDQVMVWHDPADPQESGIVGENRLFGPMIAVLGVIFLVAGLTVLLGAGGA